MTKYEFLCKFLKVFIFKYWSDMKKIIFLILFAISSILYGMEETERFKFEVSISLNNDGEFVRSLLIYPKNDKNLFLKFHVNYAKIIEQGKQPFGLNWEYPERLSQLQALQLTQYFIYANEIVHFEYLKFIEKELKDKHHIIIDLIQSFKSSLSSLEIGLKSLIREKKEEKKDNEDSLNGAEMILA